MPRATPSVGPRARIGVAVVAVALVVSALAVGCTATEPGQARSPSSTGSSTAGPSGPGTDSTAGTDAAAGAGSSEAGAAAEPTASSKIPSTAALPGGSLPPPSAAPTPEQVRLHLPLPERASAAGKVVTGFPSDIVPVPAPADIVATSVTGQDGRLQFALQATSASAPADVVTFYRTKLAGSGFVEEPTVAPDGSIAASFVRANEGIVVSVRTALGGGSQISVAGALQAVG